ncbi:MAG: Fe-S cluster assembly protein SufD [Methylococcales bacterium]|nr:Fe-S cluster assembly protein SufD [Methylococcales bacterium]
MSTELATHYSDDYSEAAQNLSGKSVTWLNSLRSDAFARFSETGFPKTHEEEWRYTNLSALEKKSFKPAAPSDAISETLLKTHALDNTWQVVLIDGHFSSEHSQLEGLDHGVELDSIAERLKTNPETLAPYLGQAVNTEEHNFIAFNTAWFIDGFYLNIPSKHQLSKPIQIINFVFTANCLATTRNIIVLNDDAEAQVIETFIGCDTYLTTAVNEIFIGENADLTLYKVQIEANKAYHFGGNYIKQQPRSRFQHHNFAFGSLLARNDLHTDLETASECLLNGLYLGVKRQHIDNHTRINHLKPEGISREFYKGILDNRARGVFQGRVVVIEDAQKTDSEMNNRNLLLSNEAEIDTKPQLEIYADDVKCAHGVTIGQLDEKSIFYLQSRGLDIETAKTVLTLAFANEMVEKIPFQPLKTFLGEQLIHVMPTIK